MFDCALRRSVGRGVGHCHRRGRRGESEKKGWWSDTGTYGSWAPGVISLAMDVQGHPDKAMGKTETGWVSE